MGILFPREFPFLCTAIDGHIRTWPTAVVNPQRMWSFGPLPHEKITQRRIIIMTVTVYFYNCKLILFEVVLWQMQLTDPNCGPLDQNFFRKNKWVAKSPVFIDDRQVSGRHKLPPGIYCIIPSTFEPGEEGDFLLRIFSEKPISSRWDFQCFEDLTVVPALPNDDDDDDDDDDDGDDDDDNNNNNKIWWPAY